MLSRFYDIKNFKGDFTGGLVAGVVALPLALAFGVQSGMGATAGLYGAIAVGIFAALFGGTETQASGPTGPMTVVSAALVAAAIEMTGSLESGMSIILLAFLLGGLFQVIFGLMNIASYVKYFPYPVVSGFMSGVGLIIVILQLFPFAGLDSAKSTVYVVQNLPKLFTEFNVSALILGAVTIAVYFIFPKITKAIPSALVALIVATLIAYFAKMEVPLIGEIPSGLPSFQLGGILEVNANAWSLIIEYGLVLAVLGSIDSLLTSVIADNMTKTKHNSNKELVGQGIRNSIAAIFGGIPGAGATIRTVVNINAGGKTKLSGMIAGVLLLVIMLGFSSVASKISAAVLAGILVTVGIGVMDYKGLRAIPSMPKDVKIKLFKVISVKLSSEVLIMITVLVLSSLWDLVYAVGIGLVIASLMFMKKIGDLTAARSDVKSLGKEKAWADESGFPVELKEEVFIKHIKGPLFFGSTSDFQALAQQIPDTASTVIMRLDRMQYMDQSGLYAMEDMLQDLKSKDVEVLFVGLLEQPRYMMERIDIIPDFIPTEHIFEDFNGCLSWVKENVKDEITS